MLHRIDTFVGTFGALLLTTCLAVAPAAHAQDDLDDILGETEGESSVREEREALEREADAGVETETIQLAEPPKRVIKGIVPKSFIKLGRFEAMPYVGIVTNDPFIRRILFGATFGYHITEIFELELHGSFSPNFGQGDLKTITRQITEQNQVSPEISRQVGHATLNFNFSPFYGKVATPGRSTINFDLYGTFGAGIVYTEDDLELVQKTDDDKALATANQVHPAISFGGGLRVAFNKTFALRFEIRSLSYIGVLESTQLELRNNLMLGLGASFFFGRRIE